MGNLLDVIKQAAVEANNAADPSTFMFGTVVAESPLKIQLDEDNKILLTKEFLVVPKSLTDYDLEIEIEEEIKTEKGLKGTQYEHEHKILGRKKIKVLNHLENGDRVTLVRQSGGQKYFVAGKVET